MAPRHLDGRKGLPDNSVDTARRARASKPNKKGNHPRLFREHADDDLRVCVARGV